jgi:septation ring formation regulator EzrA
MLIVEMQRKSEIDDKFMRKSTELEKAREMYVQAQNELMKVHELLSSLNSQNMQLRQTVTSLQTKFEEASALVEKVAEEKDVARREALQRSQHGSSYHHLVNCTEFTYTEIKEATKNFDLSLKIGEGGFGAVYKGFLRSTNVAIKILHRDSTQGDPQFYQEVSTK